MKTPSKKFTLKSIIVAFAIIVLSSCQQASYKEDLAMESVEVTEDYQAVDENEAAATTANVPVQLKIIKSASARYKVEDVKKATEQVKAMAQKYNGYVSDLRFENNLYEKQNRFTIKVPNQYFDVLLDSIASVAVFTEYENITTQDVTEEYLDLESRLATKKEVKARYEEILRKNAKTVEDILATEEKLRRLQEEIEAAQGRLKYLSSKVSYSTVQIDLYEAVQYKDEPKSYTKSFFDKAGNGFNFGWNLIEAIVIGLIHIWPVLLVVIGLVFFLRLKLRKK
ncbi:DUF4349 domain-containing protein [Marinirhabdus gelatinilytica]|uniref:Uncharacterized protein DUF4349 n=1 Tax=Marinirhabdus gelatinilytica TaxID=1703343 RepID=A0A370QLR7_9FLAO|nr:DUF4349 domain-containing protein [Marinirhabdus gelatinilytica]RDK89325.1 uncharacterized protein DUF4349 [Marinirhabdus gelatinilytica]